MNVVGGRREGQQGELMPLSKLFSNLTKLLNEVNGVKGFELTRTTLEQVFVSFARFQHNPEKYREEQEGEDEEEASESELENKAIPANSSP